MEEGNKDSMTKARWLNHRGVIASFLRTLPKLNSISIGFVPRHTRCAYPETFYNIVSLGFKWHQLRHVRFIGIEGERQEILEFFALHKDTLRSVQLCEARLKMTAWTRLFR